jgi:ketosteroid isomerase-like protein
MLLTLKRMFPLMMLVGGALIPAASPAQAARKDARTEIPALDAKMTAAYNAGHPETVAQAYAADAVVMPPNGAAIRGAKAITDWWNGAWKMGLRNFALTSAEVYVEGNVATETGTYALDMPTTEGGAPVHDTGKYMVLWKRSPTAGWQLFRDIFNSNLPMPQMAEGMKGEGIKGEGMNGEMKHEMAGHMGDGMMNDSVMIVVNPIKADRRADFEQWVKEFWGAGLRASDESVRRRFMSAHVVTPTAASPDGTWPYVIAIHPYHAGEDYIISSLTRKLVAASDTTRLNGLLSGARAAPPMVMTGKMAMEGMAMK